MGAKYRWDSSLARIEEKKKRRELKWALSLPGE